MTDQPKATDGSETAPAADPGPATEPLASSPEQPEQRAGRLRRLRARLTAVRVLAATTVLLGVAVVLLALMVFAPTIAPLKLGSARLAAQAGDDPEIAAVAERFLESFLTMDYRTLEDDYDRVVAETTGSFSRQMQSVRTALAEILVKARSVSEGEVTSLRIEERDGPNATVRAHVRRTIRNRNVPDARPTTHEILLQLIDTSAGWKVESMSQVGGSGGGSLVPN